jgi:hypothetical protein
MGAGCTTASYDDVLFYLHSPQHDILHLLQQQVLRSSFVM